MYHYIIIYNIIYYSYFLVYENFNLVVVPCHLPTIIALDFNYSLFKKMEDIAFILEKTKIY
jgi:hypothetical protein